MPHTPRFARTPIPAVIVGILILTGCSPSAGSASEAGGAAPSPPSATDYVALGDSWPHGGHCGGCTTFAGLYADGLQTALGATVAFDNRTTNGGDTQSMLADMKSDEDLRDSLSRAEVVMISTGPNDLDSAGALSSLGSGTCGADSACLTDLYGLWEENFAAILEEIAKLRGGAPTVVRLVTPQNIFVSDPSIAPAYGLPEDFGTTTGLDISRKLAEIMCTAASDHGGHCVDVVQLFNGPDGTTPRDENTPESHQDVADALVATGTAELDS